MGSGIKDNSSASDRDEPQGESLFVCERANGKEGKEVIKCLQVNIKR